MSSAANRRRAAAPAGKNQWAVEKQELVRPVRSVQSVCDGEERGEAEQAGKDWADSVETANAAVPAVVAHLAVSVSLALPVSIPLTILGRRTFSLAVTVLLGEAVIHSLARTVVEDALFVVVDFPLLLGSVVGKGVMLRSLFLACIGAASPLEEALSRLGRFVGRSWSSSLAQCGSPCASRPRSSRAPRSLSLSR